VGRAVSGLRVAASPQSRTRSGTSCALLDDLQRLLPQPKAPTNAHIRKHPEWIPQEHPQIRTTAQKRQERSENKELLHWFLLPQSC